MDRNGLHRRRRSPRIRRTAPPPGARHRAPARPPAGPRGTARRRCRPRRKAVVRSACTGRRRGVRGAAACFCRAPAAAAVRDRVRRRACPRPWPRRRGRARPRGASRRKARTGCDRAPESLSRTWRRARPRDARRCGAERLAAVGARPLRVPARLAAGPEPRVAGAAGRVPLLAAGFAQGASGPGRRLPALRAQALRDSPGGAPVVALQVAGAPGFEVVAGHRDVLSAGGWNPGKGAPPAVGLTTAHS